MVTLNRTFGFVLKPSNVYINHNDHITCISKPAMRYNRRPITFFESCGGFSWINYSHGPVLENYMTNTIISIAIESAIKENTISIDDKRLISINRDGTVFDNDKDYQIYHDTATNDEGYCVHTLLFRNETDNINQVVFIIVGDMNYGSLIIHNEFPDIRIYQDGPYKTCHMLYTNDGINHCIECPLYLTSNAYQGKTLYNTTTDVEYHGHVELLHENYECRDSVLEKHVLKTIDSFSNIYMDIIDTLLRGVVGDPMIYDFDAVPRDEIDLSRFVNKLSVADIVRVERDILPNILKTRNTNDRLFIEQIIYNMDIQDIINKDIFNVVLTKRNIDALTKYFNGTFGEFCTKHTIESVVKNVPTIGSKKASDIDEAIRYYTNDIMYLGMSEPNHDNDK